MHSSQSEITTEPTSQPDQAETLPGAPDGHHSRFIGAMRLLVVAVIVLVVGFLLWLGLRTKSPSTRIISGSSIISPDAMQSLRLKGTTEAVLTRAILAPVLAGQQVETLTITKLAVSGSHVRRGDLHDKRALELGALPPLDIYRSESEVASRRVQVIQSEYALKQFEDALRLTIGADQDDYFRALDLDLTEKPEPEGELRTIDAAAAMQEALSRRPEFEAVRYALANDDTSIRLAHNHLEPDLSLTGFYQSNGLGGNQYSLTTNQLISRGGLGSSFNQVFGFGFPGYGATLTLNLPLKNRAGQADLGDALTSRHRDLYSAQQVREQVTLEVSNAVHQLEQSKLTLAAGKTALDLAQKTLAAEQRKYELGAETIFFVLDAQTKLAQAESDLLLTEVQYQAALAAVDHATGSLLEPYHVQIAELTQ